MGIYEDTVGCSASAPGQDDLTDNDLALEIVTKMDGNVTPLPDDTGNGHTCAVVGAPTLETAGLDGDAVRLNTKTTDYLTIAQGWNAGPDNHVSVSMMFKLNSPVFDQHFLSLTQQNTTSYIVLAFKSGTSLEVISRLEGVSQGAQTFPIPDVNDGAWHNITIVYDKDLPGYAISIDGRQYFSKIYSRQGDPANWHIYYGLQYAGSSGPGMTGDIDECRVWFGNDGRLTPNTIKVLGAKGASAFP